MRYAIILAALFVLGCETVENHYYYGSDASGDASVGDPDASDLDVCLSDDECPDTHVCIMVINGDGGFCAANECMPYAGGRACLYALTQPHYTVDAPSCSTDDDCRR